MNSISLYFYATISLLMSLVFVYFASVHLIKNNKQKDLRIIYYFFSLSLVVTSIIILWGVHIGAITSQGSFKGYFGNIINHGINIMLDIPTDFMILSSLLVIIILPQILNYIISGLFGCAGSILFIEFSFNFILWFFIKSFLTIAGILSSVTIFGFYYGWKQFIGIKSLTILLVMALLLILYALFVLSIHYNIPIFSEYFKKITNKYLWIKNLNNWLTRNNEQH